MTDQPAPAADEPSPEPDTAPTTWTWTLMVTGVECAVELWRDGMHRLTLPLDDLQAEILMGKPITLASAIADDPDLGPHVEIRPPDQPGGAP